MSAKVVRSPQEIKGCLIQENKSRVRSAATGLSLAHLKIFQEWLGSLPGLRRTTRR